MTAADATCLLPNRHHCSASISNTSASPLPPNARLTARRPIKVARLAGALPTKSPGSEDPGYRAGVLLSPSAQDTSSAPTTTRRTDCAQANFSPLAENFDACNGMNFIPTVVTVGDVGAGDADTIADIGNHDLRMKSAACDFVTGMDWRVLADYLRHEFAMGVQHVDQIQNRFMFGIERDMHIAIRGAAQGDHATLDSGTLLNYMQPFLLMDMLPQVRITVFSLQLYGRLSCIAKSRHQK